MLIAYGFIASVIPVWLLLAPRDYLSTFLKIGTIIGLAIGILIVRPELQMPAVTRFIDGSGPVFAGNLFPSCSSPSPAAPSRASTPLSRPGRRRRWWKARRTSPSSATARC
jgi:carbon starvation protein